MQNKTLIIFTKIPYPGTVKSRLLSAYSRKEAATIYAAMLSDTLLAAADLTEKSSSVAVEVYLANGSPQELQKQVLGHINAFCPADKKLRLANLLAQITYCHQKGENIGERMYQALFNSNANHRPAILIGCDCPGLTASYLRQAFISLEKHPTVLTPTLDNGYCLIGSVYAVQELFANIAWGTDTVLPDTIRNAQTAAIDLFLLPQLQDIDTPLDLANIKDIAEDSLLAICLEILPPRKIEK